MTAVREDAAVTDPVGLVVRLVGRVEHHLDAEQIREVVIRVGGRRASRRRLARALRQHPEALRTGRPPAAFAVARLLLALREAGAQDITAPRCGECDREVRYPRSRRGGSWGCSGCFDKHERCAGCGEQRRVVSRDRHGRPRCAHCPDTDPDTLGQLAGLVTGLDPALDRQTVVAAVRRATVRPVGQQRLAWAVLQRPDLLTGNGHLAPTPAVLRFVDELVAAGAMVVARPACPRCHRVMALSKRLEGQRVCRACFARGKAVACSRCGAVREPAARDAAGGPLCPNCLVNDPVNLEACAGCGRARMVAVRTASGPRCSGCRPRTIMTCAICGRTGVCELSRATSQPWCLGCQQWWARCSGCGTVNPVRGGTRAAPLCARCVNPDPEFWARCPTCQATWQLSSRPCQRCVLDQQVRQLLGDNDGRVRPDLTPLQQALTGAERPHTALTWLSKRAVRTILIELSRGQDPLTHEALDALPAGKTLEHLRSVLVATGALPARDERLVKLERWITRAIGAAVDPVERRVLHGYAVWHHLRRLRQRLARRGGEHATHLQALNVRCHVTAAANFLGLLRRQGRTLATCTQADLDRWTSDPRASYRDETGHFVRWAVEHRHASQLTFGTHRWEGPRGPLDTEKRWADARRLLHDTSLQTADWVAGLLLVLYAQRIATISQLTVDHVHADGDHVELLLGRAPIVLPEPLASLVLELVTTRRGQAALGALSTTPWLFPGGRPGQPIGDDRLGQRLQRIGLSPRQDRSTALFQLATQLPAAILARTLGLHIAVALQGNAPPPATGPPTPPRSAGEPLGAHRHASPAGRQTTMPKVEPPSIASDQDYAHRLGDLATWEPLARAALDRAGIPQPARVQIAHPLGTYPTLMADSRPRLVVKLFGDRYHGPQSHTAEHAAYQILASHDLPLPRLVAAGDLFPHHPAWPWPFLVVTELPGRRYATLASRLDPAQRAAIARSLGRLLRRLHDLPLPPASTPTPLAASCDRFLALLHRRRRDAPADHRRWGVLPAHLCDQLEGWLPDPERLVDSSRPPVFVHGDLHDEHVFVDPASATLHGVIDFTDVYAGDPRYDLVALHFHTFRLDASLLGACLDAYGRGHRPDDWPQQMLAFTLLHDFNMFRPGTHLDRFTSLDELADTIWALP